MLIFGFTLGISFHVHQCSEKSGDLAISFMVCLVSEKSNLLVGKFSLGKLFSNVEETYS